MSRYEQAKSFCTTILDNETARTKNSETFVTLTYAQSLDGKISGRGGQMLTLSCEESMIMTHRLRTLHDGILIGIGTLLNDDPRLTARLLDSGEESSVRQPQPIILDSKLRFPLSARILSSQGCKAPWIFTSQSHDIDKRHLLEQAGARVIPIDSGPDGQLSIDHLLKTLSSPPFSISRLMVEGGAQVISSFLKSGLVNLLIVTIAPVLVGANSISVTCERSDKDRENENDGDKFPPLSIIEYKQFGKDIVMVANVFPLEK
ncbi:3448_t:CDS:2 [Acaulospora morrowiae]|uniref:2,5-diamino-6-ribosylamino-4(3H)-pyrimidinone 5'-phosphate reductase n=1 Tax=Acaulospora morrowiae TaxID=94023 RepID=A0A9N8VJE8_9GLOM|nr:3448_t:CDS:2 [Acaulospora morrowiae]